MLTGRVDANGLAERQGILSPPSHSESAPSEQQPVTARTVPAQSGAPCAAHSTNDYDKTREWETRDEQTRFDEAQDEALRLAADRYEHREDVP